MFVFKSAFRSGFLSEETYELEVICCLSFIIWITLLLGVAKYCFVVLRADNYGEGGMLALFCSIPHPNEDEKVQIALEKYYPWIYSLALLGCAFILGDGMIVPAISMLAALEGFHSIEHGHPEYFSISVKSWITPSACAFLFCLFSVQRFGLGKVSWIFPPILIVWCLALFCIGVAQLVTLKTPLNAFCPWYMIRSVQEFGVAYTLSKLSIVLLVVAGMEFFYADLGAFKRRPMTISYTMIVVPSILSSYLGQASFLLQMQKENHVDQILNDLFFESSPSWLRWPLVILGMLVSAVGSQSVLSGCFALLDQAITLRALPPFLSKHLLAGDNHGTYFVPFFNFIFFLGSLLLAIVFKDSVVLSDLFGLCVSGAMLITSILTMIVMYVRWNTKVYWIVGYCVILMLDIIVFIAALTKLTSNAYISLFFSIAIFVIMYTYKSTCDNIDAALEDSLWTTAMTRQHLRQNPRIDGLGVFISNSDEEIPHVLSLLASKLTSLPKNVVVVTTNCMRSIPFVASEDRLNFRCVDPQQGLYRILLTHGFAERPMPISIALLMAEKRGLRLHKNLTYFVSRIIIYVHSQARWYQRWRYYVFEVLTRNVQQRDQALQLPPHQVMWVSSILELK
ncbi:hypothetical protein HMI54_007387 [Coelomomyces lativittatus]|nr:hypothetical protein HMI54_007387 [Coelomomyces lativittatus]